MTKRKPKELHQRRGPKAKPIDLALLERLAQRQGSIREIAACLGMTEGALRHRIEIEPALQEVIDRGHGTSCMTLRTRMWNSAMEGVPSIQIFLAKNYLGMADVSKTELTGKDGKPLVESWLDLVKAAATSK